MDVDEAPGLQPSVAAVAGDAAQELLLDVFDNLPHGVCVADGQGRPLYFNREGLRLHGFRSMAEMFRELEEYSDSFELARLDGELLAPDEWPVRRALRGEPVRGFEVLLRREGHPDRFVSFTSFPLTGGAEQRLAFIIDDISERVLAERRSTETDAALRSLVDQMPIGVIIARVPTGDVLLYNQAAQDILGHPVLGESAAAYGDYGGLHPDGRPYRADEYPTARAVLFGETVQNHELDYRRGDGRVARLLINASPISTGQGSSRLAVCTFLDISDRKRDEERLRLLVGELGHRVKNILSLVQAMAAQSFRVTSDAGEARRRFEERLQALAGAHDVLNDEVGSSAPIGAVVRRAVDAVAPRPERVIVEGPEFTLPARSAVALSMAMHELATNAVKYGALSLPDGAIEVRWRPDGPHVELVWREQGGPPVKEPATRGFGTRMLERGLSAELGGEVLVQFRPEGVSCRMRIRLG